MGGVPVAEHDSLQLGNARTTEAGNITFGGTEVPKENLLITLTLHGNRNSKSLIVDFLQSMTSLQFYIPS